MRAGRLRHRVRIDSAAKTRTASGGYSDTWSTVSNVWASIEPLQGREYWERDQAQGETTHKITMRYKGSITSENRIVKLTTGTVYHPISVINPDERNISLVIMAKEQN